MPKLFIVQATIEVGVWAHDAESAVEEAFNALTEATSDAVRVMPEDLTARIATDPPKNWTADESPFSSPGLAQPKISECLRKQSRGIHREPDRSPRDHRSKRTSGAEMREAMIRRKTR